MAAQKNIFRSALQLLQRIVYGKPGQKSRVKPKPEPGVRPSGAWGTRADGSFQQKVEPLEHPPLQILRRSQELQKIYAELVRVSGEREKRYKDYEDMILDPTVSGAIELMTDDACQYSRDHHATAWIKTEDPKIRRAGEELFDLIQLEERIFDWGYNTALYGDWLVQITGQEGRGILLVQDDWHPSDIQRLDVNGALLGFRTPKSFVETAQMGNVGESIFWDPWEFVHFRIQASQRRRREVERERMAPMLRFEKDKYRLTTRYGVSVVESVRRVYKQLMMVEQSLIISRMSRALLKYIYKVQCGEAASPKEAVTVVHQMRELLTQQTGFKIGESFDQQYAPLSGSEDIFLPVFGDRGDVSIETLGGEVNITSIVDVDRLTKKFFGGLKVPAAFLGFEDNLPSSLGDSALVRIEIRYARTVKRLQRTLIQGLTRLFQIHLAYKRLPVDPKNFSVEMEIISSAEEEERKASLSTAVSVASDLARLNSELRIELPKKEFAKLIYSDVLAMPGSFVDLLERAEELPTEGEEIGPPGGDMGPPMPTEGGLELPPEEEVPEEVPEEGPLAPPPAGEVPPPSEESVGVMRDVKRGVMEAVTSQVRRSPDVRAETPSWDRAGHLKPSKIKRHARVVGTDKATDLARVIAGAVMLEAEEKKAEKKKRDKLVKELEDTTGQMVQLVEAVGHESHAG